MDRHTHDALIPGYTRPHDIRQAFHTLVIRRLRALPLYEPSRFATRLICSIRYICSSFVIRA